MAEHTTHNGLFITFEGGEGGGKSTQASLLKERLSDLGLPVLLSREPGATALGAQLRALLLHPDTKLDLRAEALIFAADRAQHVSTVLKPALDADTIVLCDRYMDSSLVYQGMGRGHGVDRIRDLSLWAGRGIVPDLTILLDLDPKTGVARAFSRGKPEETKFEREQAQFHRTIRAGFLELADAEPDRFVIVDATAPAPQVAEKVWDAVSPRIQDRLLANNLHGLSA